MDSYYNTFPRQMASQGSGNAVASSSQVTLDNFPPQRVVNQLPAVTAPPAVTTSKKRVRKEPGSTTPRKRAKAGDGLTKEKKSVKIKVKRQPKPRRVIMARIKAAKKAAEALEPTWKPIPTSKLPKLKPIPVNAKPTALRPRLWTTNRDELISMLPEMNNKKCVNGISWRQYETPMLILDETSMGYQFKQSSTDPLLFDLVAIRNFICPPQPAAAPSEPAVHDAELEQSLATMNLVEDVKPTLANAASNDVGHPAVPAVAETVNKDNDGHSRAETQPGVGVSALNRVLSIFLESASDELRSRILNSVASGRRHRLAVPPPTPSTISASSKHERGQVEVKATSDAIRFALTHPDPHFFDLLGKMPLEQLAAAVPSLDDATREAAIWELNKKIGTDTRKDQVLAPRQTQKARSKALQSTRSNPSPLPSQSQPSRDPRRPPRRIQPSQGLESAPAASASTSASTSTSISTHLSVPTMPGTGLIGISSPTMTSITSMPPPPFPPSSFAAKTSAPTSANSSVGVHFSSIPPSTQSQPSSYDRKGKRRMPDERPLWGTASTDEPSIGKIRIPPRRPPTTTASQAPGSSKTTTDTSATTITSTYTNLIPPQTSIPPLPAYLRPPPPSPNTNIAQDPSLVPTPIPKEMQTLITAYTRGKPMTILASRERLYADWDLALGKQFGYVVLGHFRIVGVQELRVNDPTFTPTKANVKAKNVNGFQGQAKWLFRLYWTPGGEEEFLTKTDKKELLHAWWNPPPAPSEPEPVVAPEAEKFHNASDIPMEVDLQPMDIDSPPSPHVAMEDAFATTFKYRQARTVHPEYKQRSLPTSDLYSYALPSHFTVPFTAKLSDSAFPRGWVCAKCGRMNFQKEMRHRRCANGLCKNRDKDAISFSKDLFLMRDMYDRIPIAFPYNKWPRDRVNARMDNYADSTTIHSYLVPKDSSEGKDGSEDENDAKGKKKEKESSERKKESKRPRLWAKQIFAHNMPKLQTEATEFLKEVQENVHVKRKFNDPAPYFYYTIDCPKGVKDCIEDKWPGVHDCMNKIRYLMFDKTEYFAEVDPDLIKINRMEILAWVTAGKRKAPKPINAKKHPVTFLCLGSHTTLTVHPQSMIPEVTLDATNVATTLAGPMEVDGEASAKQAPNATADDSTHIEPEAEAEQDIERPSGWISAPQAEEGEITEMKTVERVKKEAAPAPDLSASATPKKPRKKPAKKDMPALVLSLVHGDLLVLFGDEFEYYINRKGPSYLVMGSCEDV